MIKNTIVAIGLALICFVAKAQVITTEEYRFVDAAEWLPDSAMNFKNVLALYPAVSSAILLYSEQKHQSWLGRKWWDEHLIVLNDKNYSIAVDPVIDLRYGREGDSTTNRNTRGFVLNGVFGKNFIVRSEFYETQTVLPGFASAWVDTMKVIPGMIDAKPFGSNGFDYGVVFSQIMWQPFKNYGIRLGYDRFHIGKGYRSMVLSDASQAYPFLMNSYSRKKWSLSHNIATLTNPDFNGLLQIERSETGAFQQKWFSFTYLTFSPTDWLNLGLYESVIFMPSDSTGISFYPLSMLPISLVRTGIEEAKGLHHAMVALLVDATLKKKITMYSQLVVDEIPANGQALQVAAQIGFRWIKQSTDWPTWAYTELNVASNNSYNSSSASTAYTNHFQPLAHPTGQQFVEWNSGFHFSVLSILADIKYNIVWGTGLPVTDSYLGVDSYSGNGFYSPQANTDLVSHLQITVGYRINRTTNLTVFGGLHYRNYKNSYSDIPTNTLMYEIGIRHLLRRQYYDFF